MRASEHVPAELGVGRQAGRHEAGGIGCPLHVTQLTDVVLAAQLAGDPAEEAVTGRLHQSLPLDDALAHLRVRRGRGEGLEDGVLRLLHLEGEDVVGVAALEQEHPGEQADAADADHLVAEVDDLVALEQRPAIGREALQVAGEGTQDECARHGVLGHAHHQRRLVDEHAVAVHDRGELADGRPCGARLRLGDRASHGLLARLAAGALCPGLHGGRVDTVVPDVDLLHGGVLGHGLAILPGAGQRRVGDHLLGEAVVASGEHEGRCQALHIPLEGPGIGLIEVVDVEDRDTIGCGEEPEVGQVRVTTELHLQAARGLRAQVAGHDDRRTAIEGEGARSHPLMPQGQQARDARLLLVLEQRDGIGAMSGRLVGTLRLAGQRLARGPAAGLALLRRPIGAEGEHARGCGRRGHPRRVRAAVVAPGAVTRCGSSGVTSRRSAPRQPVALRMDRSTWPAARQASSATAGQVGPGP